MMNVIVYTSLELFKARLTTAYKYECVRKKLLDAMVSIDGTYC